MKKIIILFFIPLISLSQNIQWQWAKNTLNPVPPGKYKLFTSPDKSFYLTSVSSSSNVIVRYDSLGNELVRVGINNNAIINDLFAKNDEFYITGSFSGSLSIGSTTIISAGMNDVFICKFSVNGNNIWLKRFGGVSEDLGNGICGNLSGDLIVTGRYTNTITFDSFMLSDTTAWQLFVIRMDTSGNIVKAKSAHGIYSTSSHSEGLKVVCDKSGNFDIVAEYSYFKIDTTEISGGGGPYSTYCLIKLDSSFKTLWGKAVIQGYINEFVEMGVDSMDNPIVCGYSHWTNGGHSILQKYSPTGTLLWQWGLYGNCGWGQQGIITGIASGSLNSFAIGSSSPGAPETNCPQNSYVLLLENNYAGNEILRDTISSFPIYYPEIMNYVTNSYIVCGSTTGSIMFGQYSVTTGFFIARFNSNSINMGQDEKAILKYDAIVYPNPTEGIFSIQCSFKESYRIKVFDSFGNIISESISKGKTEHSIDLRFFSKGIFFVEILGDSYHQTQKIIHH